SAFANSSAAAGTSWLTSPQPVTWWLVCNSTKTLPCTRCVRRPVRRTFVVASPTCAAGLFSAATACWTSATPPAAAPSTPRAPRRVKSPSLPSFVMAQSTRWGGRTGNLRRFRLDAPDRRLTCELAQGDECPPGESGQRARLAVDLDRGVLGHAEGALAVLESDRAGELLGIHRRHDTGNGPLGVDGADRRLAHAQRHVDACPRGQVGQFVRLLAVDADAGVLGHGEGLPGHVGRRLVIEGEGALLGIDRLHGTGAERRPFGVEASNRLLVHGEGQ